MDESIFLFYSMHCILACHNPENKSIENILSKIERNTSFRLDSIEKKSWDTLCVLKPYKSLADFSKVNFSVTEKPVFENLVMSDEHCTLVFIKNKQVVSYAVISRSIANLSGLNSIYFTPDQRFRITNEKQVVEE